MLGWMAVNPNLAAGCWLSCKGQALLFFSNSYYSVEVTHVRSSIVMSLASFKYALKQQVLGCGARARVVSKLVVSSQAARMGDRKLLGEPCIQL